MNRRERERENSKTLILKDSSVRSIWTYLTASFREREREREREVGNSSVELFIAYGWMGKSNFRPLLPLENGKRFVDGKRSSEKRK